MRTTPCPDTITITALSHDGRGVATIDGKTTFVSGAIASEKVLCAMTKKHRRYNEAMVTEVIEPSPSRVTPQCQHFSICGGCTLQHISTDAQIRFKQNTLLEQLKHFGNAVPKILLEPITGNPWHYRRKARLGVRYVIKKEKLLVGFREKFSNYLTDIQSCLTLDARIGLKITDLADTIKQLQQYDAIPQVEVAAGDDNVALVFRHMTPLSEKDKEIIIHFGKKNQFHIYFQPNPPEPIKKMWPDDSEERLQYTLPDYDLTLAFHPLDFIQINAEINQKMIGQAIQLMDPKPEDTILDLFCGLGNFTLPLSRFAKKIMGVEGSNEMVKRAKENAVRNHIENVEFHMANLMEPPLSTTWMKQHYHTILLDPPRTGAKEIIAFFPSFHAKKIIYVSCNPATLARDAGLLIHSHGYDLKKVGVIDMFPHTSHIETIALFEKR